jgi:haloacetate dehalogenase
MSEHLFPGFDAKTFNAGDETIFARLGGSGPPLLLLHGFPQDHHMWHKIAPRLAEDFSLVIADLPGYGRSSCPANDPGNIAYSKRAMANSLLGVMDELGHDVFFAAAHDRGGRVGYRMALDHPARVGRLAMLDIVPTYDMWQPFDAAHAMKIYHWLFLAQPRPLPETMINAAPHAYQDLTLASWTKSRDLRAFAPAALEAYHEFFDDEARIHALCNDYRAGQTIDLELDRADRDAGRKITCPVLALWGEAGIPAGGASPLEVWQRWAENVTGLAVDAGHFVAEENPEATLLALTDFFATS